MVRRLSVVFGIALVVAAVSNLYGSPLPGDEVSESELVEMKAAATIAGYCMSAGRCSVDLGYCNPFSCGGGANLCGYHEGPYNQVCYPYATAYQCETALPAVTPCVYVNSVCLSYYTGCHCYGTTPTPIGYGSYTVC